MSPPRHKLSRYGWQPADPPRQPVLFVNPRSGGGTAERAGIVERARQSAIEVVMLTPGQSLPALVRAAVANGADALGMAGGDGSLAVVAAEAAAHGLPFVCIPAGTRNHFALDLGVDRRDVPVRSRRSPTAWSGGSTWPMSTAGCFSTTSHWGSTGKRSAGRRIAMPRCAHSWRRSRRCWAKRPGARAAAGRRCGAGTD